MEINHLSLFVNYPITIVNNNDVSFFNLKDTIHIYSFNNLIIYKLKPKRVLETNERIDSSEKYLAFKRTNTYGFLFNSNKDINDPQKVPVDSILIKEAFGNLNFQNNENFILHETIKKNGNAEVVEKYYFKLNTDEMLDSVYHYYTNSFNTDDYSLSKTLDSVKQLKLFKVRLIYNSKKIAKQNMLMPKREYSFEIRKEPFSTDKTIMSLFAKLEKED
jgi:hypothetical protein